MDGLPQINEPVRIPVTIAVEAYLRDHRFDGRAVFPAVEAMRLLTGSVLGEETPDGAVILRDARFPRFLTVPDDVAGIDAVVETKKDADGGTHARLITRFQSGKTAISRKKVHAELRVSMDPAPHCPEPPAAFRAAVTGNGFPVPAESIYRELVPFGPSYRNLRAPLNLFDDGVCAALAAPDLPAPEFPLGSPFPLDAAFHAACVWGQRYAGVVAFPTAVAERAVIRPTRAGESYTGWIRPVETDPARLVFDIWIYDAGERLCEAVTGIEMRDVSAGRWKPPAWILAGAAG